MIAAMYNLKQHVMFDEHDKCSVLILLIAIDVLKAHHGNCYNPLRSCYAKINETTFDMNNEEVYCKRKKKKKNQTRPEGIFMSRMTSSHLKACF